jgi:hypothetical protein
VKATPEQTAALIKVARGIGDLKEEVVLVGGIAVGLLITDSGSAEARPTVDVDLVVEEASRVGYYEKVHARLRARGFHEDTREGAPPCRWLFDGQEVDVMSPDPSVFGASNSWYPHAIATANWVTLSDEMGSLAIKVISAPAFLATKLEAFASRGAGDLLHRDIEDVVYLIDGRAELMQEIENETEALQTFVAQSIRALFRAGLEERVSSHLGGDLASQAREPLVLERLHRLAALTRSGT